jgi:hypothetical protein
MLLQFTVIMAILLIWALTSLLSREAQPLPPRTRRAPGPEGLRAAPPARMDRTTGPARYLGAEIPPIASAERRAPARLEPPVTLGRPVSADDGIIILESDSRSRSQAAGATAGSTAGSRLSRGSQARRSARGRPQNTTAAKPTDVTRPRALTTLVTQSMAQKKARRLEITPLSAPLAPLSSPLHQITGTATPLDPGKTPAAIPPIHADALRAMLAQPTRIREAFLISEILQPPVALRRSSRGR